MVTLRLGTALAPWWERTLFDALMVKIEGEGRNCDSLLQWFLPDFDSLNISSTLARGSVEILDVWIPEELISVAWQL